MKKKYITKLMIAACLSSALSLNSCIEEVFPESSTATIDQIGKSEPSYQRNGKLSSRIY